MSAVLLSSHELRLQSVLWRENTVKTGARRASCLDSLIYDLQVVWLDRGRLEAAAGGVLEKVDLLG